MQELVNAYQLRFRDAEANLFARIRVNVARQMEPYRTCSFCERVAANGYHATCDHCDRPVCGACAVQANDGHFCPSCPPTESFHTTNQDLDEGTGYLEAIAAIWRELRADLSRDDPMFILAGPGADMDRLVGLAEEYVHERHRCSGALV